MEMIAELAPRIQRVLVDAQDLLVDRDRLGVEALVREDLGDLRVRLDRLGVVSLALVNVADLEADVRVLRVRLEELLVLLQRPAESPLLRVLLRRLESLALVDSRRQLTSPATRTPPRLETGPATEGIGAGALAA